MLLRPTVLSRNICTRSLSLAAGRSGATREGSQRSGKRYPPCCRSLRYWLLGNFGGLQACLGQRGEPGVVQKVVRDCADRGAEVGSGDHHLGRSACGCGLGGEGAADRVTFAVDAGPFRAARPFVASPVGRMASSSHRQESCVVSVDQLRGFVALAVGWGFASRVLSALRWERGGSLDAPENREDCETLLPGGWLRRPTGRGVSYCSVRSDPVELPRVPGLHGHRHVVLIPFQNVWTVIYGQRLIRIRA